MGPEPNLEQLDANLVRDRYIQKIKSVPSRVAIKPEFFCDKKKKIRKPIDQILEISHRNNCETLSAGTIKDHTKNIQSFLKWLQEMNYTSCNFSPLFNRIRKDKKQHTLKEKNFTDHELKLLFETESYRKGLLMPHPERHWAPLIGLLTGARESEICQIHLEDIVYDEKAVCWTIDFNAKENKQLKTSQSARIVPVHTLRATVPVVCPPWPSRTM